MIVDTIGHINRYANITSNLKKAIDYIQANDLSQLEAGKHEIHGTDVFVIISEYQSKNEEDCKPEAHENYIDIQMILSGEELIGYAPLKKQEVSIPYNPDKDVVFFKSKTNKLKLVEGEFGIFFPNDIHQPGIQSKESTTVKKAVFKVAVE